MPNVNYSLINNLLEAQNEKISNIAFGGGGAKGVLYIGVVRAILEVKILDGVNTFMGTSVGSLVASALACGCDGEKYLKIMDEIDFAQLIEDPGKIINNSGKRLYGKIRYIISDNIKDYLTGIEVNFVVEKRKNEIAKLIDKLNKNQNLKMQKYLNHQIAKLESDFKLLDASNILEKFSDIKKRVDVISKNPSLSEYKITFEDLAHLRALDPKKFKDLYITALERDKGELKIFNYYNSPHVDIASAARASCSIPIYLESISIDGKNYLDGGIIKNIPADSPDYNEFGKKIIQNFEHFESKKRLNLPGRTIIFAFENDDLLAAAYGKPNIFENNVASSSEEILSYLIKLSFRAGGSFNYYSAKKEMYNEVSKDPLNLFIIPNGGLRLMDLHDAGKNRSMLAIESYISTLEKFNNLGIIDNSNIDYQSFLFDVLKKTIKGDSGFFGSKRLIISDLKKQELCSVFNNIYASPADMCKDFMKTSMIREFGESENGIDHPIMVNLIKKLNDRATSDKLKTLFVDILDIKLPNSQDKNKAILDFKFTKQHFLKFILNEAYKQEFNKKHGIKSFNGIILRRSIKFAKKVSRKYTDEEIKALFINGKNTINYVLDMSLLIYYLAKRNRVEMIKMIFNFDQVTNSVLNATLYYAIVGDYKYIAELCITEFGAEINSVFAMILGGKKLFTDSSGNDVTHIEILHAFKLISGGVRLSRVFSYCLEFGMRNVTFFKQNEKLFDLILQSIKLTEVVVDVISMNYIGAFLKIRDIINDDRTLKIAILFATSSNENKKVERKIDKLLPDRVEIPKDKKLAEKIVFEADRKFKSGVKEFVLNLDHLEKSNSKKLDKKHLVRDIYIPKKIMQLTNVSNVKEGRKNVIGDLSSKTSFKKRKTNSFAEQKSELFEIKKLLSKKEKIRHKNASEKKLTSSDKNPLENINKIENNQKISE